MQLGAFEILDRLAAGGMGEVWRGRHVATQTPVAIKVLTRASARDDEFQEHFQTEIQATARLSHPSVIAIFDLGVLPDGAMQLGLVPGSPYYVMELVPGGALSTLTWNFALLRHVLLSTLGALAHSHARGILHLDIKPANILWSAHSGGIPRVVLTDFGLAEVQERGEAAYRESDKDTIGAAGTPPYMAPEQFLGAFRDFGPWTDLYALGVMAFEIACGELPFRGPNFMMFAHQHLNVPLPAFEPRFDVPVGFKAWVQTLLAKDPRDRFDSAARAARALAQLGDVAPQAASSAWLARSDETVDSSDLPTLASVEVPEPPAWASSPQIPSAQTAGPTASVPQSWREATDRWVATAWLPPGLDLMRWRTPPFVGRQALRDTLWASFVATVEAGSPHAVALVGRHGTGKSRLARWLQEMVRAGGYARTLTAVHHENAGGQFGISGLLAEHFGCIGLAPQGIAKRVDTLLQREGVTDPLEAKAVVDVIQAGRRDDGTARPSMALNQRARVEVARRTLVRAAQRQPLVVLIDDAHFGTDAVALVRTCLDAAEAPILFVMTAQHDDPEALQSVTAHERTVVRHVENLGLSEAKEFAREGLALSGRVADVVAEHTLGNPLYATQLVQHWIRTGELTARDNAYTFTHGPLSVPKDMSDVWSAAVDGVVERLKQPRLVAPNALAVPASHETLRTRIEVAAALGTRVDRLEWDGACRQLGVPVVFGLTEELVESGLATTRDGGFVFANGLLRETLCRESRESGRWARIHLAIAKTLEGMYQPRASGFLPRLARHYLEAGSVADTERLMAQELHRQGVFGYSSGVLYREIVKVFDRVGIALDDPRWLDLWLLHGEMLAMESDPAQTAEGLSLLAKALEEAKRRDAVKLGQALRFHGWCQMHGGDTDLGVAQLRASVEHLRGHSEESLSLTFLSLVHWERGEVEESGATAEEGLAKATSPIQEFYGHQMLGHVRSATHRYDEALVHITQCREIADRYGMLDAQQAAFWSAGEIHFRNGAYEQAVEAFRGWVEISDLFGRSDRWAISGNEYLGRALALAGEYDEALHYLLRTFAALKRGESGVGALPGDAILLCAVHTGNESLFESVFQDAFAVPENLEADFHRPVLQALFKTLDARRDMRLSRCVQAALAAGWDAQPTFRDLLAGYRS